MERAGRTLSRRTIAGAIGSGSAATALVVLGLGASTRSAAAQDEQAVIDAWAAAWSSGSPEEVLAVFADDGVYEDVSFGLVAEGSAAIADFARSYFEGVANVSQTVEAWVATPTGAVVQWRVEYSFLLNGNQVVFRGVSLLDLAEGQVTREIAYYDQTTITLQQGGSCVGPGGATPAA